MAICVSGESGDSVAPAAMQNNSSPPQPWSQPLPPERLPQHMGSRVESGTILCRPTRATP